MQPERPNSVIEPLQLVSPLMSDAPNKSFDRFPIVMMRPFIHKVQHVQFILNAIQEALPSPGQDLASQSGNLMHFIQFRNRMYEDKQNTQIETRNAGTNHDQHWMDSWLNSPPERPHWWCPCHTTETQTLNRNASPNRTPKTKIGTRSPACKGQVAPKDLFEI